MPNKKRSYFRRILVWVLSGLVLLILALVIYFLIVAIDRPPEVKDISSLSTERVSLGNNTFTFGNNWLRKSESGLWEAYIEGEPFERGVAFGQLTRELLYYQETSFVEQIREIVPSERYLKVLKYFTAFFNRNLDKNISGEYKEEIYGTSFACSPEYDFIGSGYQRQLNYHAAHDIGHALQGLNLVACTSFSLWDGKTRDSALLIGRNFDFYMGEKFAENKIVCFVNPSKGYKFMMITWPDLIGVVSGMNEKGLTITINASKSSIPSQAATPVTILAREILQYASNIEEAWNISEKRKLFVSESIMVGSARDHKTAIIEKSPDRSGLVNPEAESIICANHYQGREFAKDPANLENIHKSDSYERYSRVYELVNRQGEFDVPDMVHLLRDRLTLGDVDAGMGNQLSVNQFIAHHAVVFKPDSLQVWVSTAPWQLGKFVAYDLRKIFDLDVEDIRSRREIFTASLTIAADTFLHTAAYRNFRVFQYMTSQLNRFRKSRDTLPSGFAEKYTRLNPAFYLTYVHLGDYYRDMKDYRHACTYYEKALSCKLPGLGEKENIRHVYEKTLNKTHHGNSRN